ncbi:MAG: HRDC domain-containing protein [Myxococcota bacterium]
MRFKLFTLRYSPTLGGFDDEPLQSFVRDKEVSGFREHFFVADQTPHLACVVTYQDLVTGKHPELEPAVPARSPRGDPAEGLDPVERALFQRMREWRSQTAREEGVPPYVVLTNRELIAIVRKRPDSLAALAAIEGIGRQKIKRFGKQILVGLHGALPADPEPREEAREESE